MSSCPVPKDEFTILLDGSVVACCYDHNRQTCFGNKVDGIGVEDLFTNGNRIRKSGDTEHVLGFLAKAKTDCKPVWVIEYGTTSNAIQRSIEGARENGFLLLVTDRDLKTLGDAGVEKSEERFRLQVQRK